MNATSRAALLGRGMTVSKQRGLTAAALFGATLAMAVPALAKAPVDPNPIAMSDAYRLQLANARSLLTAGQWSAASSAISALSPSNSFESYTAQALRYELTVAQRDVKAQRAAVTALLKSPWVPAAQAPRLHFAAAYFAYMLGDYDDALAQLGQAKALGYDGLDASQLTADTYLRKSRPKDARPFLDDALNRERAAGRTIPAAWYDRAISLAYQAGDWKAVGTLYRERLAAYPSREDWRTALANSLATPGLDSQLQLDLYRLQAANGAMASERDYQAYAMLAEKAGYNAEAKSVIEAGRAAGKLTTTQKSTATLMKTITPKATKEIAGLPAAATKAGAAKGGSASMAVADSYFSLGQYPQAATYYRQAIERGGVDSDRAHSRLGVALARSGDLDAAKAELAQAKGNWSEVAGFWSIWVDHRSKAAG